MSRSLSPMSVLNSFSALLSTCCRCALSSACHHALSVSLYPTGKTHGNKVMFIFLTIRPWHDRCSTDVWMKEWLVMVSQNLLPSTGPTADGQTWLLWTYTPVHFKSCLLYPVDGWTNRQTDGQTHTSECHLFFASWVALPWTSLLFLSLLTSTHQS